MVCWRREVSAYCHYLCYLVRGTGRGGREWGMCHYLCEGLSTGVYGGEAERGSRDAWGKTHIERNESGSASPASTHHSRLTKRHEKLKRDTEIEDIQSCSVIYQLTKTMLSDENHKITPGICTRVALMIFSLIPSILIPRSHSSGPQRQAYTHVSDGRFWDEVNKVLDSIKSLEEEKRIPCIVCRRLCYSCSARSPYRFLKKILNHDHKTYGVSPGTAMATPDSAAMGRYDQSPIQRLVEDAIASRGSRGVVHT